MSSAGTLQVGDGSSSGSIIGSDPASTINVGSGATLKYNHSDDFSIAGTISGPGLVEQSGAGKFTITGSLGTSAAPVSVTIDQNATLQVGDGSTTTAGVIFGAITNSGSLVFNRAGNVTQSGVISGAGSVQIQGAGVVAMTANFTHTGGTTISAGTLQIGGGGTSGSLAGDVTNNSVLAFNRSDDLEYHGVISGSGTVNQLGSGTLTLSGANAYLGGTNVSAGAIRAVSSNSFGDHSSPISISAGSVLANAGVTISNPIVINPSNVAAGTLLAGWTFENSQPMTAGPFTPEEGINAATAATISFHAVGMPKYASTAGNGSPHSFSSDNWSQGDYYQFTTDISGYSHLFLSWNQNGSNTGPKDFTLQYSTDGTTFPR